MAIEYTLQERAFLLASNTFDPIIVNGLKKAGFTDKDIEIGHKYLLLQEIDQLARELLTIWDKHSEDAIFKKEMLIKAVRILYSVPKSEKVQQSLDAALNDRNQKKWQDVIEAISKEKCEEIPADFVKVVMELGRDVLNAQPN